MKKPILVTNYINVYKPKADVYKGPSTESFKTGEKYDLWVPNDHIIIKGDDNCWHSFGITHPVVANMTNLHEAEHQSFHAVSQKGDFVNSFYTDSFDEMEKVLYPQSRPNEDANQHSPAIVKKDGLFYMFYGPKDIRYAVSENLYDWKPMGTVFSDVPSSRDPNIFYENGTYHITYCRKNSIVSRTSTDLIHWSDATEIFTMKINGEPESPCITKYDDYYYLFWCIWDSTDPDSDPYDDRTFVYASKDITNFNDSELLTQVEGHCPEILIDEKGDYYISSAFKPYNGINVAKLDWID